MISSDTLTHLSLPGNCIICEVDWRVGKKGSKLCCKVHLTTGKGEKFKLTAGQILRETFQRLIASGCVRKSSGWHFALDATVHTELAVAQRIRDSYSPNLA